MKHIFFVLGLAFIGACAALEKNISRSSGWTVEECSKNLDTCFDYANSLLVARPPKPNEAAKLFARLCELTYSSACVRLGLLHAGSTIINGSNETAAELFKRACELGHGDGCARVGAVVILSGGEKAAAESFPWFERACQMGVPLGCQNLAALVHQGHHGSKSHHEPTVLLERAQTLLQAGCEKDHAEDCCELGKALAFGNGVEQDLSTAKNHFQKGCDLNDGESCAHLGIMYQGGQGVTVNEEAAEELFGKSCSLNHGRGCNYIGTKMLERGEPIAAMQQLQRACELRDGLGCYQVAALYGRGAGVVLSQAKAFEFYRRSCELQFPGGCNNAGRMYQSGDGIEQNYHKAFEYYERVCNGVGWCRDSQCIESIAEGCNNAGAALLQGIGTPPNNEGGLTFLKKGCQLGNQLACANVKKACDAGLQEACAFLTMMRENRRITK